MFSRTEYTESLFNSKINFEDLSLQLFHYQYENNRVYRDYLDLLKINPNNISSANHIPYLPIGLFKTHQIQTGTFSPELIFESSGTTETTPSRHYVKQSQIYEKSFRTAFQFFYGDISNFVIIGLLPSYLERKHSSLVYMVNDFIQHSGHKESGFYLNEFHKLKDTLIKANQSKKKVFLIGVTFGLLDFAEEYKLNLENTIVMETGGMKGRRKEQTRDEVQNYLKERLGVQTIHSEYGMTELLSQAYSKKNGIFQCPPWMKVTLRDSDDPLTLLPTPQTGTSPTGLLNIIDLANIDSCAFIATDDIGILHADNSFEVRGRRDLSDLRGCSLMAV